MNVRQVLPKDAIPSIDDPAFGPEYVGEPDDEVMVLDTDPPRAYPVRILNYHEIVNDDLGGDLPTPTDGTSDESDPVAVTWCPLCGSAVVYERVVDGRRLSFGVSGKLADDDLVLYDRETGSEWKQSLGTCIDGELAGTELSVRPASLTTWAAFRETYPDGVVLQPPGGASETASDDDTPAPIDYDAGPYEEYFESEGFGLAAHRGEGGGREWARDDLDPKTVVLGIETGGAAVGFPLPRVEAAGGVVQTTVGERDALVVAAPDGFHAFADPGYDFALDADGQLRGDGTTWSVVTGEAADGRELERLPARRLFAFAWQDDHGRDAFWE